MKVDGEWKIATTGYKRSYEEMQNRADVAGPASSPPAGGRTGGVSDIDV